MAVVAKITPDLNGFNSEQRSTIMAGRLDCPIDFTGMSAGERASGLGWRPLLFCWIKEKIAEGGSSFTTDANGHTVVDWDGITAYGRALRVRVERRLAPVLAGPESAPGESALVVDPPTASSTPPP